MRVTSCCFLLFAIATFSTSSAAANLVVNASGNCDGTGQCFARIQDAIDAAGSGDTIVVMPGTYNECVNINKPLRLRADDLQPMDTPHQSRDWSIVSTQQSQQEGNDCSAVSISGTRDVTVEGFLLAGGDGIVVQDSARIIVRDNFVSGAVWTDGNFLTDRYVVLLRGNVTDSEVTGNRIDCQYTEHAGITVEGPQFMTPRPGRNTISHNLSFGGCSIGIAILDSDANTISNNEIATANRPYDHPLPWGAGVWLRNASSNALVSNTIHSVESQNSLQRLKAAVFVDSSGDDGDTSGNLIQVNDLAEPPNPNPSGIAVQIGATVSSTILRNNLITGWAGDINNLAQDTIIIGQRGTH